MKQRYAWLAASAAGILTVGLIAATPPASAAATGCSVAYTVQSQWPGGFTTNLTITNLGSPIPAWTLAFEFPNANQRVGHGWSATWSQAGPEVSAASMSWNGSLGAGASTSVGFVGAWSGANPVPAVFTLNENTCDGTVTQPTTSPPPTSPPPTSPPPSGPAPELHVSGNRIVTDTGQTYRLLGVNRSSGEYACVQGKGQWDFGPVDQASVDA